MLQPQTLLNERYRVLALVGRGGMGAVYEAVDERLRSRVALKQTTVAGEGLSRAFEREAQILAGLRHPALPRVIDHFVSEQGQFLVMEFIPGQDLAAELRELDAPFPAQQLIDWGTQLLDALEYLHGQSPPVIHRDIKPQNLKLTPRGEVVLLDFGLAKGSAALPLSAAATTGSLFGYTPQYASLEQVQGGGTDARSDLYSLAATLYHLGTGTMPPDALARATELLNARPDPLRPAHELRPSIPRGLSAVLAQGMALNAAERFNSASAMRRALASAGEPSTDLPAAVGPTIVAAPTAPAAPRLAPLPAPTPRLAPLPVSDPPARRRVPGPERRFPLVPLLLGGLVLLLLLGGAGLWLALGGPGAGSTEAPAGPDGASQPAGGAPTTDPRESEPSLPPATPVSVGEELLPLEGVIATPGEQDAYSFELPAGQQIFVATSSFDGAISQLPLRLLDANGDEVQSTCLGCGNMGVQTLRAGGRYTLVVGSEANPATGGYLLRVNLVPPPRSFDVALDARIGEEGPAPGANFINVPGVKHRFRFEAPAGQRIFVETARLDASIAQLMVRLLDANGDEVQSTCLGCGNMGVQTLRAGGGYTLEVGSNFDPATGAFELRVTTVPPPESRPVTLPFEVGDGLIARPGAIQRYTFEAEAGQEILVRTSSFDSQLSQLLVRLLDANGDELKSTCLGCGDLGIQTLRAGGTYSLEIGSSTNAATGAYGLAVTLVR